MAILNINFSDFIKGEGYSNYIPSAGFSSKSYGINLAQDRGVLHFVESATERGGSTLTGDIIATSVDPASLGNEAYFIADDGSFYTYNGTTLTERRAAASNYSYELGTTDVLPFVDGNFYFTSKTTIGQFNNNMGTVTEDWWSGLNTTYRHPIERVESELFVADKNLIYYWDGTNSGTAFTLPSDVNVTTLRKHPDGRTLLAFTGTTADFSHTRNGSGKVYYCNPSLRDWTREVDIESQVEGSRLNGGIVYTTWGKNFGYFDGNGLVPLKRLETSGTTYSQSIGEMEDTLIFRDGRFVVAFGDVGSGQKVFWKLARNDDTDSITVVMDKGDNVLMFADAGTDLREIDLDNAGANGTLYLNKTDFGGEANIRRIDLLHDVASTYGLNVQYTDLQENDNLIEAISYSGVSTTKTRLNTDVKSDIFQLNLTPTSGSIGIKAIRIHYDPIK